MSQHDFNIANQGFPSFRSDLNAALAALASNSSGASAPSSTYANQFWYDETANILKMRDEANANWISLGTLDQVAKTFSVASAATLAGLNASVAELNQLDTNTFTADITVPDKIIHTGDTDTAIRFPAANTVSVETGGAERFRIAASGQIGIGGANYGTEGQVLTSGGSGAAPSWETSQGVPSGAVMSFAMNTAPTGWLKANGAAVSRTTYAALFTTIGTTFGVGNGSTTFNLPDLRGEFMRGWDDGRGVDTGRVFGSAQGDAIRNISGQFHNWAQNGQGVYATGVFAAGIARGSGGQTSGAGSFALDFDASRAVPTATENRPRNIALLACIKF